MSLENMTVSLDDFLHYLLRKWKTVAIVVSICVAAFLIASSAVGEKIVVPPSEEYLQLKEEESYLENYNEHSIVAKMDAMNICERILYIRHIFDREQLERYIESGNVWGDRTKEISVNYLMEITVWERGESIDTATVKVQHYSEKQCGIFAEYLAGQIKRYDSALEVKIGEQRIVEDQSIKEAKIWVDNRLKDVKGQLEYKPAGYTIKLTAPIAVVLGVVTGVLLSVIGLFLLFWFHRISKEVLVTECDMKALTLKKNKIRFRFPIAEIREKRLLYLITCLLEILLMILVFVSCDTPGMRKYFLLLLLSIGFFCLGKKEKRVVTALICVSLPTVCYLIIGFASSLIHGNVYMETVKIALFWMFPLLFSVSLKFFYGDRMPHAVDIQFVGCCVAYVGINARFLFEIMFVESTFAFAFGAFFLYYTYKRRWGFCCVAALLIYLTDKRIVILAVAVAVSVMGIMWLFRNDKRLGAAIWGIAMAAVSTYLWLICSGTLEYYCKGIGINTNGRVKMYSYVTQWFEQSILLTGQGLGIVEKLLAAWNIETFANLHNDLLKFYIELGVIGLLVFLLSYSGMFYLIEIKYGNRKMSFFLAMTIYSMVLYATDNVSIYILYLIPVYSIFFAVLLADKKNDIKELQYDKQHNE